MTTWGRFARLGQIEAGGGDHFGDGRPPQLGEGDARHADGRGRKEPGVDVDLVADRIKGWIGE